MPQLTKKIRILGVDPSLHRTGWGIVDVDHDNIIHVDHGIIAPKQKVQSKQLYMIAKCIGEIFRQYRPNRIALEETFCGINQKTNIKLGFAVGAIISTLGKYKADINLYPTRIIKMRILKGNAKKDEIHKILVGILSVDIQSFDMSDALAAAICDAIVSTPYTMPSHNTSCI